MKVCEIAFLVACCSVVQAWLPPTSNGRAGHRSTQLSMGVQSTLKRVRDSVLNKERTRDELKVGIAGFYDRSSKLWEDVWGEVRRKGESISSLHPWDFPFWFVCFLGLNAFSFSNSST